MSGFIITRTTATGREYLDKRRKFRPMAGDEESKAFAFPDHDSACKVLRRAKRTAYGRRLEEWESAKVEKLYFGV